jgi:hypothetical protein
VALEPARCYHEHMDIRVASLVIDVTDAESLAQFWAAARGWRIVYRGSYGVPMGGWRPESGVKVTGAVPASW